MNMVELKNYADTPLRGTLQHLVPMRKYTSWRAGGIAEHMFQPADLDDLLIFLRGFPVEEPLYAVGMGSNLLVRDGGLRGTVLMLHGTLGRLHLELDGSVYAEAGVPGAKLARFAALHNRQGAEFFAGIPGSLGGMLAMNAGCYGSETWEKVLRVQTVNRFGVVHIRTPADYEIGYRHVAKRQIKDTRERVQAPIPAPFTLLLEAESPEFFIAAWLGFSKGDGEAARQNIKALLSKRIATQPLNLPNAGSVFRNPPGDHAARLIEQCGLKGKLVGGAQISMTHANFIVNTGAATAEDIEKLIVLVQAEVLGQTGINLHPEVRIVGEHKP